MGYRVIGLCILAAFYAFYFAKLLIQKRQSIRTNQMGKGSKPKKVLWIERIMSVATMGEVLAAVCSVLFGTPTVPWLFAVGTAVGVLAVLLFAAATITMKTSWRVGIPEEKTALITGGIYGWSRNPAFLAFDLLYLSACLQFFNLPLLLISAWAAVMLHLQILQEEAYLCTVFGEEYNAYRERTRRYFGRKVIH